jgi:hypothetical protein
MPRGGPRPNSGGARPGAGRKKLTTEQAQQANRDVVLEVVTPQAWATTVRDLLSRAGSDPRAFAQLAPYVMGSATAKVEVAHSQAGPMRVEVVYVDTPGLPAAAPPGPARDEGGQEPL